MTEGDRGDAASAAWAARLEPAQATTALELLRQHARDEDDPASWIRAASAELFVAQHHSPDPAMALAHVRSGLSMSRTAVEALAPDALEGFERAHPSFDALSPEGAVAVYWHAQLVMAEAELLGFAAMLIVRPLIVAAFEAVERVHPACDDHGATVQLAIFDARPLDAESRDLARAKARFDRAIDAQPLHRVARAEHYAVIRPDRALFQEDLEAVIQLAVERDTVETTLAERRAQHLLTHANELFE